MKCSVCEQFFHLKCINLTTEDLDSLSALNSNFSRSACLKNSNSAEGCSSSIQCKIYAVFRETVNSSNSGLFKPKNISMQDRGATKTVSSKQDDTIGKRSSPLGAGPMSMEDTPKEAQSQGEKSWADTAASDSTDSLLQPTWKTVVKKRPVIMRQSSAKTVVWSRDCLEHGQSLRSSNTDRPVDMSRSYYVGRCAKSVTTQHIMDFVSLLDPKDAHCKLLLPSRETRSHSFRLQASFS